MLKSTLVTVIMLIFFSLNAADKQKKSSAEMADKILEEWQQRVDEAKRQGKSNPEIENLLKQWQQQDRAARYHRLMIQAAEHQAIDRLTGGGKPEEKKEYKTVQASSPKEALEKMGSKGIDRFADSDDGYKSLQETAKKNGELTPGAIDSKEEKKVEDLKLNRIDKSKRDKAPGFIQIFIDAWDFITFWN